MVHYRFSRLLCTGWKQHDCAQYIQKHTTSTTPLYLLPLSSPLPPTHTVYPSTQSHTSSKIQLQETEPTWQLVNRVVKSGLNWSDLNCYNILVPVLACSHIASHHHSWPLQSQLSTPPAPGVNTAAPLNSLHWMIVSQFRHSDSFHSFCRLFTQLVFSQLVCL